MTDRFDPPYPGYDILAKWDSVSFDDTTRRVYADRLKDVPERAFFSETEWRTLNAVCDRLIPQPDRPDPIPIAPWIDRALAEDRTNGTRYTTMPQMREAWRTGLAAIEAEAQERHETAFSDLTAERQDALLRDVSNGDAEGPHWNGMPPHRFFRSVMLNEVVRIYYAHPAALSEIGFGGPAAPRGYVRLGADRMDPWEAPSDRRRR